MSLKSDLHDRLWNAYQRWHELREMGETKHELKMRGLHEHRDVNHYTRGLIFTGNTLRTYDKILQRFIEANPGTERLEDLGKPEFRAFMDKAIADGLAAKTLRAYGSALAKFGALTGQTRSFAALSEQYARKVRELTRAGELRGPERHTPSVDVLMRAIDVLRTWDARHFARTGDPRAYHFAARIQWETSARGISATERVTPSSLVGGNYIKLVGKGAREDVHPLSPDLHAQLRAYLAHYGGPLADLRGYQCAYRRAVLAAGGRATGTHGVRRASAQSYYGRRFGEERALGRDPHSAAETAAQDAIERLGHSRDRDDHRRWYLGR